LTKLNKHNPLSKAVKYALLAASAATAYTAPAVFAAEEKAEEEQKIIITGSRIKRANIVGATPITVITAEDMANAGRFSVADALRDSTANQFGSFNERSGSSAQSQATISLLGAGSDRTLVLLDGKRLPGSPSLGGTAVNLNQIPMAMVERIEIMKDGGSAIYGSDAIAGVINIILKHDYEGVNFSGQIGRPTLDGGDTNQFSLTTGISGEKGNITVAFEHQKSAPIFDRDRSYTAPFATDRNGDGVIQAYSETGGNSYFGATVFAPDMSYALASAECDSLTANVDGFMGEVAADEHWGPGSTYCMYSYAGVSANKASQNRNSLLVSADYQITDDINMYTRAMVMHNKSFGRYAPPAAWWGTTADPTLGGIPRDNPNVPQQLRDDFPAQTHFLGAFRWTTIGTRDNNIDDYTQDYIVGLTGDAGDSVEWETYIHYNLADNKSIGEFYQSKGGLQYNITNGIALDSPEGIANLRSTTLNNDKNEFIQYFAGVGFETGELGGGAFSHYLGGEFYDITYQSKVDAQSEAGLVGGSSGNSSGAERRISSVFYEAVMPFTDDFTATYAIRYDRYSDFGSEVSPKFALEYRPMDSLLLRASVGQGFRAPTLSELTQADAFSAEDSTDYVQCAANGIAATVCPSHQVNTTVQSNSELGAETSEFTNIGMVWSFGENMNIEFDYFNLSVDNVIQYISVQDLIYAELVLGEVFDPTTNYTGYVRAGGASTPIITARTGTDNGPGFEIKGIKFNFSGKVETGAGEFGWNWDNSYFLDYSEEAFHRGPVQDASGWSNQPDYRTQVTFTWSMGDHAVAWNTDYIANTAEGEAPEIVDLNATGKLAPFGKLDSFMTHNFSYSYNAGDYGRYTLGVRNLTEEEPILDGQGKYPRAHYDLYTPGHLGRTIYLGYSFDF